MLAPENPGALIATDHAVFAPLDSATPNRRWLSFRRPPRPDRLAALMFGVDRGPLADAAALDALAEFTNVVGGNVKALISEMVDETCVLGQPVVASGELHLPPVQARRELHFACGDDRLCIAVLALAGGAVRVAG